jgi:uncharacterized protein (TIGR00255 family)
MTGFARVRETLPEGEIVLSVKSVNHRALDLHFHLPPELDPFEQALRKASKDRVVRGHLQIHVTFAPSVEAGGAALNKPLLAAYLAAFEQAVDEFALTGRPDLNAALRIPGMIRADAAPELRPEMEKALVSLMEKALDILNKFREREGAVIAGEMRERCGAICDQVSRMEKIRSRATAAFQKRLKERLSELLRGAGLEPQRLAQEAAVLADRSDVSEELVRLKTHAGQVDALLQSDGEAGKKLDFLLQEMNREANTILSKTGGLGELGLTITELALAAKSEIDKIREQSLNLE